MPLSARSASLAEVLDGMTAEAAPELTERLGDGSLRCYACGHRCLIGEGRRGICKVRFNERGRLLVPANYVAALACDPTEKKPFFHLLPGSDTLTFGMLGCDLHCGYCFDGETVVVTDRGPLKFRDVFESAARFDRMPDGEIAYPEALRAVAASGQLRRVRAVFKHPYRGPLAVVRPYYLPELRCTPDHRLFATADPACPPELMRAGQLTPRHYLAVPRRHSFSSEQVIDVARELGAHEVAYRVPWGLSEGARREIADATARGETSWAIGARLGKDASYVRHVRSKLARGLAQGVRVAGHVVEGGALRFPNEHRPGIPVSVPLGEELARLLGLYCAEGCVVSSKTRPNSHVLNFSFSHGEAHLVEVRRLLRKYKAIETENFYLVPVREISSVAHDGPIFNMEVEEEHSYLANFFAVSNCQNWLTSQALRDDAAGTRPKVVTSGRLVEMARECGARVVGSSYNEPLITAEWGAEVLGKAKAAGLKTVFISNGNATPEVLDYLRPLTDCYKIDLKTMSDRGYRQLGGVVGNILDTVRMVYERGFWEEIVTLVVPGFNDSEDELRRAADFIASVSPDIPWHVTAFHRDYRMTENADTTAEQLVRACELGREAGLRYVYAGNLPGRVGRWENTYCPSCDELLVERRGYRILRMKLAADGLCPNCATRIPGVWG